MNIISLVVFGILEASAVAQVAAPMRDHRPREGILHSQSANAVVATLSRFGARPSTNPGAPRTRVSQDSTLVWLNTQSGVYHCRGSQYFGSTKRGRYLTESAARAGGYRPAYGRSCGPAARARSTPQAAAALPQRPGTLVWLNSSSGVYHCPGSRYFENTKRGRLLSEAEARRSGYRPAYGKACE